MDFFDPVKQKRHTIRLIIGYVLIAVALALATTILLYQAYGYGLDKNGRVIQSGLVFVSSQPAGANISINGTTYKNQTNTRMNLPAGQYLMELTRDGYRPWRRALTVEGGSVERFDYPMLFPIKLTTTSVKQYTDRPDMTSVSLDRRWLLVGAPGQNTIDEYDLNAAKPEAQQLTVPEDILAAGSTTKDWQAVEWASDNQHVLLKRTYDKLGQTNSEYILFDRQDPTRSQNMSVAWGFTPARVELNGQAYDQYYLYDQANTQLFTATLKQPTPQLYAQDVLAFATQGNTVAYATTQDEPTGKVGIIITAKGSPTYEVRQVPSGTTYLLKLASYDGTLYFAAGAQSDNKVLVFKDPLGQLRSAPTQPLVPVQILKVTAPTYVSFSSNQRIVMAENGTSFSVYDVETDRSYAYQVKEPLDAPQAHATWMDGFRLVYMSGGDVIVSDYDGTNRQTLSVAAPALLPVFDNNYRYLYTVDTKNALTRTALLTPQDL